MKVIVWGYPLHTHTHSYIHSSVFRSFEYLGYETYWFHDDNYPEDFDYDNCVFFTEGFADKNIPLRKTSTYYVHVCVNPQKYLGNVKKLIDVRYLQKSMDNDNYDFILNRDNCDELETGVLHDLTHKEYDITYVAWGTNLLPHQIDFDWVNIEREKTYYFLGSISTFGRFSNVSYVQEFAECCEKIGVQTIINSPWQNPLDDEMIMKITQKSFMSPDFRNETHKKWGYIACRLMKSISYGQLGMTNSKINQEFIDDSIIYSEDISELFELGLKHKDDKERILHQMNIVKDKHTWLNRVRGLIKLL